MHLSLCIIVLYQLIKSVPSRVDLASLLLISLFTLLYIATCFDPCARLFICLANAYSPLLFVLKTLFVCYAPFFFMTPSLLLFLFFTRPIALFNGKLHFLCSVFHTSYSSQLILQLNLVPIATVHLTQPQSTYFDPRPH